MNFPDIRRWLTLKAAESLIHVFVTTKLDYCNALLFHVSAASLQKLLRVQKLAARILTDSRQKERAAPVLFDLHWLPVEFSVHYKMLLLTHKAFHGQAPEYIADLPSKVIRSHPPLVSPL